MSNPRWQALSALFHELADAPEAMRKARLDEVGAADAPLAAKLEDLLAHADSTVDCTWETVPESVPKIRAPDPDSQIGIYRLIRKIGQGGMGVVYLGHREQDFEQQVAIKLGLTALDTMGTERFLRERQILAGLSHPNIAHLIDGGTTENGLPYLVMEYVEGDRIDDYCGRAELGLTEVLRVFRKVCAGLSFAHQNLVIHRDIKPSNIIVDATGEPRLLDFGIAKLIEAEGPVEGGMTATVAMTPQYATPEQVRGQRTSTLTDVYAMGLLLYELVSGRRAQQVASADLTALQRVVCEEQPKTLGSLVSKEGEALTAAGRDLQARSRRWIGDLDNILRRALAKDPERRYPSVTAMSADVGRLLDNNPVEATGDSLWYRIAKLISKYRYRAAAIGIAALSLVAMTVGLTWSNIVAKQARDDANRRLAQSQDLIGFMLGDLRDKLEPDSRLEILDSVGERAMTYFASLDPADQGDEALAQMALSLRQIGDVRMNQGRLLEAENAFAQAMAMTESLYQRDTSDSERLFDLGQSHFWTGYAALRRGDKASARGPFERYLSVSEELTTRDPENLDWQLELSYAESNLGTLALQTGRIEEARDRFAQSMFIKRMLVASRPDHRVWVLELANSLGWLADAEDRLGRLDEALALRQERLTRVEGVVKLDPNNKRYNQELGYAVLTLGWQYSRLGRADEASALFRQALELADERAAFDPDDVRWDQDRANARLDLAILRALEEDTDSALELAAEARAITERLLSLDARKFVWLRDLDARLPLVEALSHVIGGDFAAARQHVTLALERYALLEQAHQGDVSLRRYYQKALLLAGDIEHVTCTDRALPRWQRAAQPLAEMESELGPVDLAMRAMTRERLGQADLARIDTAALQTMGYASAWFQRFRALPSGGCISP